jgi:hypothetical protein
MTELITTDWGIMVLCECGIIVGSSTVEEVEVECKCSRWKASKSRVTRWWGLSKDS